MNATIYHSFVCVFLSYSGFHLAVVNGQMNILDGLLFIAAHDRSLQAVVNEQNALYQVRRDV